MFKALEESRRAGRIREDGLVGAWAAGNQLGGLRKTWLLERQVPSSRPRRNVYAVILLFYKERQ